MWPRKAAHFLEAGVTAPEFTLSAAEGQAISLRQLLANGPAVLAFFKVSCPVCQLTFPFLERLAGRGLQIIGVSQDDAEATGKFATRFGITFPLLLDTRRDGYPASNAFGITSVPSVFLIEPDGDISQSFAGFSKNEIEKLSLRSGALAFRPGEKVPDWKPG